MRPCSIDLVESTRGRALPQVPSTDLQGRRRAGGGRADALERARERQGAAGLPLRRAARHGQDLARAHPRQVDELRARADVGPRRHLPRLRVDLDRRLARRGRDGRRLAARDRRRPGAPGARRAPAGRGPHEGLHPRRGPSADRPGLERAAEADRGAPAAPALHLLHDRAAEGAGDSAVALPDVRLPAAAAARPRAEAASDRRRRGDGGARCGPRPDRARRPRRLPRRRVDTRPAGLGDRQHDQRPGRAAAARRRSRTRCSSACATSSSTGTRRARSSSSRSSRSRATISGGSSPTCSSISGT